MIAGVLSSRFLRLGLLCVGLALAAQWLAHGWAINSWSLKELKTRTRAGPQAGEAPAGHHRAALWLAQEALATGDAGSALVLLEPRVQQGDRLAISIYGHALAMQGERAAAVQAWEQIGDFNSLQAAAETWAAEGLTSDADLAFQAAYRIKPERIANQYIDFLKKARGLETSEKFVREVLESFQNHPFAPQWIFRLGENLRLQGRLEDAEQVFRQGLEQTPGTYYLLTGLGWVYYDMGERGEAVRLFEEATRTDHGQGYGYFAMGQFLELEGRYKEADTWFEQAVSLEPDSRHWCVARGHSARDGGLYQLAIRVYQECIARFPVDLEARISMAWAFYLNQQYVNARNALEEALALTPNFGPSDWLRAGLIYEANGYTESALDAFQHVIALDPANISAQAGIERLSSR